MDSYSTLPWVTWKVLTGVEEYSDKGYYDTHWQTGLWSTQAKVEGIVLKAAWQWGSDCSVISDPHVGNQAAPHCMAFHPRGVQWMVTVCFASFSREGSLIGVRR